MDDSNPLLYPKKQPSAFQAKMIDLLSWTLPVSAAILSVMAGIEALKHMDEPAAVLGILGGVASAVGVLFTGWSSRVRDYDLAVARAVANLGLEIGQDAQSRNTSAF